MCDLVKGKYIYNGKEKNVCARKDFVYPNKTIFDFQEAKMVR